MQLVQKLIEALGKKKVIAIVSAVVIAAIAAAIGMQSGELKEAICGAPAVEVPPAQAPVIEKK